MVYRLGLIDSEFARTLHMVKRVRERRASAMVITGTTFPARPLDRKLGVILRSSALKSCRAT